MKKLLILVVLLITFSCSFSQNKTQHLASKVDSLLKFWEGKNRPGMANLEYDLPIDFTTRFHVGSVSKQFTAFAILLLEQQGKLALNDDIRKHLPKLAKLDHIVTIRHLLNHTGGIRDNGDLLDLVGVRISDEVRFEEVLKLVQQQTKVNFVPGSTYEYCNAGYMLLAKIVENVSGESFLSFMTKNVFKPLKMNHTTIFDDPHKVIKKLASSYARRDQGFARNNLNSASYGSTGLITTLEDLSKWAMNFDQIKVGSPALFKKMKVRGILNNGDTLRYALGQEIKTYKGLECIFHGGGIASYRAYLMRFPTQKFSIVVLSNARSSGLSIIQYVKKIADWYLAEALTTPSKKVTSANKTMPSKALLKSYVGSYQLQPGLIFTISQAAKGLQLKVTNQGLTPLKAVSAREFLLEGNGYKIIFPEVKKGQKASQLNYWQGDFEYISKRIETVDFDKSKVDLKQVVGRYYSPELKTTYVMVQRKGKLTALHARNAPITFTPFQPDDFIGNSFFLQRVAFVRNAAQKVIGCKISGSRAKDIYFEKMKK